MYMEKNKILKIGLILFRVFQVIVIITCIYYSHLLFPRSISPEQLSQIHVGTPPSTYLISYGQALLLTPHSRLLLFIRFFLEFAFIILLLEAFIKLVKNKKSIEVFKLQNQKTCRIIAMYMLILFFIKLLPYLNTFHLAINGIEKASWSSFEPNGYYLCGAILFVFISELFKEGSKLKEDIDLTI